MDPLSIAVAIKTLTATVASVATYINHFTKAPAHVGKLLRDIQHFVHELRLLSLQLENPRLTRYLPQDHVKDILAEAQRTIDELNSTLRRVVGENEKQPQIRRLSWLRYENKCRELQILLAENLDKLTRLKNLVNASVAPFPLLPLQY